MNWGAIGKTVEKALPLIGSLLGGPAGGEVGALAAHALGVDNSPDAVSQALQNNPEALTKLKQLELDHETELKHLAVTAAQNRLAADTSRIQVVNQTMQEEGKSEHWLQWSWRPIDGILFAPTLILLYVVLPMMHIATPDVPSTVWEAWGALLGITAWHRGVKQRLAAGDGGSFGGALGKAIGQFTAKKESES